MMTKSAKTGGGATRKCSHCGKSAACVPQSRHRIVCGDSTDAVTWEQLMAGEQADLLTTDPPYGVSYADKNKYLNAISRGNCIQEPIENDHLSLADTGSLWKAVLALVFVNLKVGGCYYMTGPQGGDLSMMMMMIQESGLLLKHVLIWAKNQHVLGRCDFHYKHEPILYGWKPGAGHYFDPSPGECNSLWCVDKPHTSRLHPTMKPVALFAKMILHGSRLGEIVLDPFAGSGTTLIASAQTGRRARCVELDPKYVDVIRRRFTRLAAERGIAAGPGALAEPTPTNG